METFIAVCLGILVVETSILLVVLVLALLQIKKTAQAVEVLSYRVDAQVAAIGEGLRSGWMKMLSTVLELGGRWFCRTS